MPTEVDDRLFVYADGDPGVWNVTFTKLDDARMQWGWLDFHATRRQMLASVRKELRYETGYKAEVWSAVRGDA